MYPQDHDGFPCLSKNGRYDLRLYLNGVYRRVIDLNDLTFRPSLTVCFLLRLVRTSWINALSPPDRMICSSDR